MASRGKELGLMERSGGVISLKEQLARMTLRNVRLKGHTYIELRDGYKKRETPQRSLPWNRKKKGLSPGCKDMLLMRMKEIKAFNASKNTADQEEESDMNEITQKEKRARCYVCNVQMEAKEENFLIPNVHYTPEITLNVLKLSTDGYFASSSSIQFQTVEVSQNVTLQLPFRTGTDTTVAVNDYPL
ncbi:hypothetical protein Tco_0567793 [Tanacetum coccineum]